MRARGPDFLAVDDPVIAIALGAGAQASDIGPAGRLGKQLAPDFLARGDLRQITSLVGFAAIGHYRRPAHAFADLERAGELGIDALLLLPDHAFHRARAASAIFLWPVQANPAALRLLFLPGLSDLDDVVVLQLDTAERTLRQFRLEFLWRIGIDPRARLGAECGFLGRVIEIHGEPFVFAIQLKVSILMVRRRAPGSAFAQSGAPSRAVRTSLHDRPLVGILLNGTSLSTLMSPGKPSTRSAMMLRMISSVPPSTRVPGARNSMAWNLPPASASSIPLSTPAAPCKSSA